MLNGFQGKSLYGLSKIASGNPVPFCRFRGLRNPWNRNLEVKIARDGQEIEPSVGATLVAELNSNVALVQS
jgi:YT521-B-like domain